MRAVNLIPADASRGDRARLQITDGLGAYVVLAVLAMLVAMTGAWAMSKRHLADQRVALTRVEAEATSAEARAVSLQAFTDFAALRQARIDTVGGLLDGRVDWSRNLRDIARAIPGDVSVTSLVATATSTAEVAGGGSGQSLRASAAGPAIELVGCARTQAQVADLLLALRAMPGVEHVGLASSEKSESSSLNETECRATDQMPQFSLTITYAMSPAAAAAAAALQATTLPGAAAGAAGGAGGAGAK